MFVWGYFPVGFFPRLLVRLMHQQLPIPICWSDAAVVFSMEGDECGFMNIKQLPNFCLEVQEIIFPLRFVFTCTYIII
jgi:hypothetical protein